MRGGLWSSFSVPGAGIFASVDPNCGPGQELGRAANGVACTPLQVIPAWNSWSAVKPLKSTLKLGSLGTADVANGIPPATSPLSYRQLKPAHGPRFPI